MTNAFPSDAEIHTKASAYAARNHVCYADALNAVTTLIQDGQSASGSPAATASTKPSDAELDGRAKRYAAANHVSYSEAIGAVCANVSFSSADDGAYWNFSEPLSDGSGNQSAQFIEGQLVEIFRAGRHTNDAGEALVFSEADIQALAAGYNPALREAPLTVGHPQSNAPAYGWVKSLQATSDGRLLMQASQVNPAFAQIVKEGRYKKRSASFYPPNHPNNPRPGNWYLRHVGWLGAQQPAVAGLPDVGFH